MGQLVRPGAITSGWAIARQVFILNLLCLHLNLRSQLKSPWIAKPELKLRCLRRLKQGLQSLNLQVSQAVASLVGFLRISLPQLLIVLARVAVVLQRYTHHLHY